MPIIPVTEFAIKRSIWLRGEGDKGSSLLRINDGKMCCVGQYLEACGVPREKLVNRTVASRLEDSPEWLCDDELPSFEACELYEENDERGDEAVIAELFASQGITVRFED